MVTKEAVTTSPLGAEVSRDRQVVGKGVMKEVVGWIRG